jgi:hypothetical protein
VKNAAMGTKNLKIKEENNTTSILVQDKAAIHHRNLGAKWKIEWQEQLTETHC